tara:strand:+ start:415 stop:675 length:261 start_codon:yes stop_codon:yes gene_type:complete
MTKKRCRIYDWYIEAIPDDTGSLRLRGTFVDHPKLGSADLNNVGQGLTSSIVNIYPDPKNQHGYKILIETENTLYELGNYGKLEAA